MSLQLQYGKSSIDYSLSFSERKTLGIRVHPDQSVEVIAPLDTTVDQVREHLRKKASWILKQQDYFQSFYPLTPPRQYVGGETHLYLGRQYRLKLQEATRGGVKQMGGYIYVYLKDCSDKKGVERLLKNWYRDKAEKHFTALYEKVLDRFPTFKGKVTSLKYRWLKSRWGSCSSRGGILLNLALIKAPKRCIEYVLIHELCHLEHHNHSRAFYALLTKHCPDWQETKHRLEKMMS